MLTSVWSFLAWRHTFSLKEKSLRRILLKQSLLIILSMYVVSSAALGYRSWEWGKWLMDTLTARMKWSGAREWGTFQGKGKDLSCGDHHTLSGHSCCESFSLLKNKSLSCSASPWSKLPSNQWETLEEILCQRSRNGSRDFIQALQKLHWRKVKFKKCDTCFSID